MNDGDSDFAPPSPDTKRPLQCDHCSKVFRRNLELNRHKEIHLDPANRTKFQCAICPAFYKTPRGLKYHLNKHSEVEPVKYPCPDCGKIFRSIEGRKIHRTISHGAEGPTFRCRECPMIFARRFHLKLHMATHGAGRHVCTRCGKSFAWVKDLHKHEAKCSKQHRKGAHVSGDFYCETCGQGFATELSLKKHVVGHQTSKHDGQVASTKTQKVRQRRSKNDVFLGLDHLVQAYVSIDPETEPVPEAKSADEHADRKNKQCQYCPMKYINLKALRNHERRKHWELMGVERAAETRGRPKQVKKLGRRKVAGPPKKRTRTGNAIERVDVCESLETQSDADEDYEPFGEVTCEDNVIFEQVDVGSENPSVVVNCLNIFDEGENVEAIQDEPKLQPDVQEHSPDMKRRRSRKVVKSGIVCLSAGQTPRKSLRKR